MILHSDEAHALLDAMTVDPRELSEREKLFLFGLREDLDWEGRHRNDPWEWRNYLPYRVREVWPSICDVARVTSYIFARAVPHLAFPATGDDPAQARDRYWIGVFESMREAIEGFREGACSVTEMFDLICLQLGLEPLIPDGVYSQDVELACEISF
jgi:hypothetical protein